MVVQAGYCFAALMLSAVMLSGEALAGSTATRCDVGGCVHIHCNSTGDRCYRYGDATTRGGRADCAACAEDTRRRSSSRDAEGRMHRLCDADGDRCYNARERHWSYREYYVRQGYHWTS